MVQNICAVCCPNCKSTTYIRRGKSKSIQCYQCKMCKRSFRDTTGTPLHHLHKKQKVVKYLEAMHKGLSIRKAATYAGISKNTSFNWRHKFLSSLRNIAVPKEEQVIATSVILQLPYSAKGRKKPTEKHTKPSNSVLIATEKQIWLETIPHKNRSFHTARILAQSVQKSRIAILPHHILTRAVKHQENRIILSRSRHLKQAFLSINTKKTKILYWMERFRGVATKYLQNYWAWFVALARVRKLKQQKHEFNNMCISSHSLRDYFSLKNM